MHLHCATGTDNVSRCEAVWQAGLFEDMPDSMERLLGQRIWVRADDLPGRATFRQQRAATARAVLSVLARNGMEARLQLGTLP